MGGFWKDPPVREFPGFFLISSNLASSNCCRSSHCSISSSKSWKTQWNTFELIVACNINAKANEPGPYGHKAAQQLKSRALSYAASKWHHQSTSIEITHNVASTQQTPSSSPTTLTVFIFHPQNTPCFSHAGDVFFFFSVRTTAHVAVRWPQHVSDVALIVRATQT